MKEERAYQDLVAASCEVLLKGRAAGAINDLIAYRNMLFKLAPMKKGDTVTVRPGAQWHRRISNGNQHQTPKVGTELTVLDIELSGETWFAKLIRPGFADVLWVYPMLGLRVKKISTASKGK